MNVGAAFVARRQSAIGAVEPGEIALHNPTVPSKFLPGLDAATRDSRGDAADRAAGSAEDVVVGLVRVKLGGTKARWASATSDRRDPIEHRLQMIALVGVGGRDVDGERDAIPIDDQVLLGAELSAVRWVRPRRFTPPFARTLDASRLARVQSIRPAFPSSSSRTRWSRSHTPASCQSRSRRQQVIPLPHPSSWGRYSHPIPVRSTNKMPVSAARSSTGGRPPRGFGFGGGINGWMRSQSASGTSGFAMGRVQYPSIRPWAKFC